MPSLAPWYASCASPSTLVLVSILANSVDSCFTWSIVRPLTLRMSVNEPEYSKFFLMAPVTSSLALLNIANNPTYAVRFFMAVLHAPLFLLTAPVSSLIWPCRAFTLFCICFSPLSLADIFPSSLLAAESARFSSLSDVPDKFFIALLIRSVFVIFCDTAEL